MAKEYKDSGIPWIGEIPKNWNTPLLKGVFREREEKSTFGEETLLSLSQYTGIKPKSETEIADSHIAANYEGYKVVHKGDFVMNIMLAWNGSYAVSDYDGMISPAYCVYYFRDDSNKRYYHYLLRINGYQAAFKTLSRGIIDSRLRLYPEQFYTFPTLQPPLLEQQRIAEFLDRKCGEIDEAIALQEEFIEELKAYKQSVITEAVTRGLNPNVKFKDSGIDWIGKIPQGWKIHFLKRVINRPLQYGANESGIPYEDNLPRYVRITDILDNSLKEDILKLSLTEEQAKDYILEDGDILFARSGGTVGKAFIYKASYGRCAFAGYLIKASISSSNDPKFVFYYTQSSSYEEWKKRIFIQSTIQNIGADRYSMMEMPIPPLSEQQQIADYLDNKCSEIDNLIAIKQQKIEELKDYKKSIIYEYVTGKKEVNG